MKKPSPRTATLLAGALGALVLALPVCGYADSSRYYGSDDYSRSYSERPPYGQGQSWQNWWQNRPGHDEWSEERGDQRRAWNRPQHEQREMKEARRKGDWDEYREEKQEAQEAARALQHHHDD